MLPDGSLKDGALLWAHEGESSLAADGYGGDDDTMMETRAPD